MDPDSTLITIADHAKVVILETHGPITLRIIPAAEPENDVDAESVIGFAPSAL